MIVSLANQQEWLRMAYGDDEAARAMMLSQELREALYPESCYGPAGPAILAIFEAEENTSDPDLTNAFRDFYNAYEIRGWNSHQEAFFDKWVGMRAEETDALAGSELAIWLKLQEETLAYYFVRAQSLQFVSLVVTGAYLFPPAIFSMFSPLIPEVDTVLTLLDFPSVSDILRERSTALQSKEQAA